MILSYLAIQLQLALFTFFTISAGQFDLKDTNGMNLNLPPNSFCITPYSEIGTCVRWSICPHLCWTSNYANLEPYFCGIAGDEPRVCCSLEEEEGSLLSGSKPTRRPPKDDDPRPCYLPNDCGRTIFNKTRVVGSHVAEKGSWPWIAVILVEKMNGTRSPHCSGALVTERYVATAAHCVVTGSDYKNMSPKLLSVRLGAHDLRQNKEPGVVEMRVRSFYRHTQFDPRTYKNDIAVLRLQDPIKFSNSISPVCLPFDSLTNDDLTCKTSTVTGFVTTSFNGTSRDILMENSIAIHNQQMCRIVYEGEFNITDAHLCAGPADGSKGSCQVDPGSPLVTIGKEGRYYLVGVASFGKLCAEPGYPGVYTRVTEVLHWLRMNMAPSDLLW